MQQAFVLQTIQPKNEAGQPSPAPSAPTPPVLDLGAALSLAPPEVPPPAPQANGFDSGGFTNPGNTAVEFWKIADGPRTNEAPIDAQAAQVAHVMATDGAPAGNRALTYGAVGLGLLIAAFSTWSIVVLEQSPIDVLTSMVAADSAETPAPIVPKAPTEAKTAATASASDPGPTPAENPYWRLPVDVPTAPPSARAATAEEEEGWRRGLEHNYTWQRHKTVAVIRAEPLRGADLLLIKALDDTKFWTRMSAAFGIAEMGVPLDIVAARKAIGQARPDLVARYFERFTKSPTTAELHVLKQALRLVGPRARLPILRAITASRDPQRALYLAAASQDASPVVARWWKSGASRSLVSAADIDRYREVIASAPNPESGVKPSPGEAVAKPAEAAVMVETVRPPTAPPVVAKDLESEDEEIRVYEDDPEAQAEEGTVTPAVESSESTNGGQAH